MSAGPGKYDDVCTQAREAAHAQGAALIIIGGQRGSGFSVQMPPHVLGLLPDMLETMAKQIRDDLIEGKL